MQVSEQPLNDPQALRLACSASKASCPPSAIFSARADRIILIRISSMITAFAAFSGSISIAHRRKQLP
ncbi:hypothetical protein [Streptomyces sp. NPDC002922]|uniref:hypothetical protein n=1 Tax=unclassified Streptomyces TaxID=2593676 RepID=UPI0033B4CED3|nr:hypothetical protein OG955_06660 [Streptomyces sp. NBC_01602]